MVTIRSVSFYRQWELKRCASWQILKETLKFLSHPVVRASGYTAVFCVEDDGPGGLSAQAAFDVLFCFTCWRGVV